MKRLLLLIASTICLIGLGGGVASAATMSSGTAPVACIPAGPVVFRIEGNNLVTAFNMNGAGNCIPAPVTIAIWKSPSPSGVPLNQQVLFDFATQSFGAGRFTITGSLPSCYWQADFLAGSQATVNGTPNYSNGAHSNKLASVVGGTKSCSVKPTPPPTPPKPPTPSVNNSTNNNVNNNNQTVNVQPGTTTGSNQSSSSTTPSSGSSTAATTSSAPSELVNTGPGDIAGIFAGASVLGIVGYRIFKLRSLAK